MLISPIPLVDLVGVKTKINNKVVYVICIYIPPALSIHDYTLIFDYLETSLKLDEHIIITGDFNIPDWHSNRQANSCKPLLDFLNFTGYLQCNSILNSNSRLLDLIITSPKVNMTLVHSMDPLVQEDAHHPSLLGECSIANDTTLPNFEANENLSYNFRKGDFRALYTALQTVNWDPLLQMNDVNAASDYLYEVLYNQFDEYVPKRRATLKREYPVWYTGQIIHMIKQKIHHHKKYKKTKLLYHKQRFCTLRRAVKLEINKALTNFIHAAENNMECDPSQLWNYINARKGTTRIPGRMVYKDTEYTAAHDIANAFSSYFSSVYLKPSPRDTQTEAYVFNDNVFSISEVSDSDILEATKKLKPKLTMGPDLVPAFIVKDCISCFVKPLCYIYNLCLKSATFPDKWKLSKVVPVFKTGDKCQIENYRPIGVICNFAKLFESIIAYYLYNHVSHCIAVEQHGFMKGRSVNTNLCNFTQYISDALDDKRQVDVIYTDISKAFDQVDHPHLTS